MNVGKIRGFLLQLPKPSLVRITGDGEPQELKLSRSYSKTADTIAALGPDLIECVDADGKVLRAMRTDTVESQRSTAAELPPVLATDPHAAMLTHFANLLHRAYEHSTEVAFTRLVELQQQQNERSASIEQRLERTEAANRRLLQDQVDDAYDRAQEIADRAVEAAGAEGNGLGDQLVGAFLNGKLQPKPNGARPPAPKGQS